MRRRRCTTWRHTSGTKCASLSSMLSPAATAAATECGQLTGPRTSASSNSYGKPSPLQFSRNRFCNPLRGTIVYEYLTSLLSMGVKVPRIVEMSRQAIQDGHCVVIGLQSTGEASLDVEMTSAAASQPFKQRQSLLTSSSASTPASDDVCGDGFVSICREILRRFIQQHFPTQIEKPAVSHSKPSCCTTCCFRLNCVHINFMNNVCAILL